MKRCLTILIVGLVITESGCADDPYTRGGYPAGHSRYDVERDYRDCDLKARMANDQFFYSQHSPFPFGSSPQSPTDHARALHGLTTMNAMRDTCLTSKGYRVQ